MRKALLTLLALLGVTALSGCMSVYSPAMGVFFTDVRGPIGAQGAVGAKEGTACARTILGVYATGDASIAAAAKAGGITTVTTVDHHTKNLLGIFGDFCTVVRGN